MTVAEHEPIQQGRSNVCVCGDLMSAHSDTIRETTIRVLWDAAHRPEGVDAEEWAYTLRMGGIDAESVEVL